MDAAGDGDDGLAAGNQAASFLMTRTGQPRISQLTLNVPKRIQAPQILGRANRCIDKGSTQRRLANLFKLDAIARGGKFLKVFDDLGPTCQLAIVARCETKDVCRSGN